MNRIAVLSLLVVLSYSTLSHAASVSFSTLMDANIAGEPVNVTVDFTTGPDSVTIEATNSLEDPGSPKQILTGVFLTLSTGENSGTLDTILSQERTVNNDGSFVNGPAGGGTTGWVLTTQGTQLLVDILNLPGQPKRGLIGPANSGTGKYDAAGGAIAGNGPHNPFFNQMVTFTLTVPGVTATSTVTSATLQFNTVAGDNVVVPEPAGLGLALMGAPFLCIRRRRNRDTA